MEPADRRVERGDGPVPAEMETERRPQSAREQRTPRRGRARHADVGQTQGRHRRDCWREPPEERRQEHRRGARDPIPAPARTSGSPRNMTSSAAAAGASTRSQHADPAKVAGGDVPASATQPPPALPPRRPRAPGHRRRRRSPKARAKPANRRPTDPRNRRSAGSAAGHPRRPRALARANPPSVASPPRRAPPPAGSQQPGPGTPPEATRRNSATAQPGRWRRIRAAPKARTASAARVPPQRRAGRRPGRRSSRTMRRDGLNRAMTSAASTTFTRSTATNGTSPEGYRPTRPR